jgi:hypothetical protein
LASAEFFPQAKQGKTPVAFLTPQIASAWLFCGVKCLFAETMK